MAIFIYTAKHLQTGQEQTGTKEAGSKKQLAGSLREEGLLLTSAQLAGQGHKKFDASKINIPFLNHVSLVEKMLFSRHLSVMVSAGLSLTKALGALSKQTKNTHFSKIITDVASRVQSGSQFADALAAYPKVFSDIFVNMIKVGETGGNLEEVLLLLSSQMKKDHELISKVRGAMTYPAVIVVAMVGIGIAMMIFVVPKLLSTFEEMQVELPASTKMIILISNLLSNHLFLFLGGLFGLIFALYFGFKSRQGKHAFQTILLKMPIFGNISKKLNSARFARILSSLIKSGVPIVKALNITAQTLKNYHFKESLETAARKVQKGEPLSQTLSKYKSLYPHMVIQMVEVGEETGTISDILDKLAEFYEEEVQNITENLSSIIEPILMIIIAGAVGFFAISMITPMYSLLNSI